MKIFAAIKGFVTTKKVASAIIGVTMIGTASAAGIVAGNHTNVVASIASSSTASSSAVSSASSSKASNTSSAVSTVASVVPTSSASSSGGTSSTPTGTSSVPDIAAMINAENTRHQNALTSINAKYDPQIAALQNEIATFKAEGARDTTADIQAQQDAFNQEAIKLGAESNDPVAGTDYTHAQHMKIFNENCDRFYNVTLPQLQKLSTDYRKLQSDQSQLDSLTSAKQIETNNENQLHLDNLERL